MPFGKSKMEKRLFAQKLWAKSSLEMHKRNKDLLKVTEKYLVAKMSHEISAHIGHKELWVENEQEWKMEKILEWKALH